MLLFLVGSWVLFCGCVLLYDLYELLFVVSVCRWLFVVCCLVCVVCWLVFGVWRSLFVVCFLRCVDVVVCCVYFCCRIFVMCCLF